MPRRHLPAFANGLVREVEPFELHRLPALAIASTSASGIPRPRGDRCRSFLRHPRFGLSAALSRRSSAGSVSGTQPLWSPRHPRRDLRPTAPASLPRRIAASRPHPAARKRASRSARSSLCSVAKSRISEGPGSDAAVGRRGDVCRADRLGPRNERAGQPSRECTREQGDHRHPHALDRSGLCFVEVS